MTPTLIEFFFGIFFLISAFSSSHTRENGWTLHADLLRAILGIILLLAAFYGGVKFV